MTAASTTREARPRVILRHAPPPPGTSSKARVPPPLKVTPPLRWLEASCWRLLEPWRKTHAGLSEDPEPSWTLCAEDGTPLPAEWSLEAAIAVYGDDGGDESAPGRGVSLRLLVVPGPEERPPTASDDSAPQTDDDARSAAAFVASGDASYDEGAYAAAVAAYGAALRQVDRLVGRGVVLARRAAALAMLGDDAACARDCDAALQQELVVGDDDEASWELDDAVRLRCARARCRLGEFGEASKRFSEVLVGGAAARGSASSAAIAALEDAEAGLRKSRASALDLGKARREFEAGDRAASRRDEEANARRLRDTGEDDDDHVVAESSSSQTTTTTPPETRYRRAAVLACGLLRSVAPGCAEAFRVAVLALAELRDWDAAREVAFRDDASPLLERALAAFGGVGPASLDRRLALAVLRSLAYGEAIRVSRDAPEDDEANGIKGTLNRSAEDTRPEQLPTIELLATVAWPRRFPRSRAWLLEDATRKTSAAGSCILALVEASRLKREGDAASRAGDPLRAAASYRAALQHDERDPVARSSLAAALQASALYEDAAREAAQALLEKPLHRRARLLRARCLGALFAEKATSVRGAPVALVDDALAEYERYLADCPRGHVPEGPAARTEMDALREQKRRLLDEAAAAAAASSPARPACAGRGCRATRAAASPRPTSTPSTCAPASARRASSSSTTSCGPWRRARCRRRRSCTRRRGPTSGAARRPRAPRLPRARTTRRGTRPSP
mmetsp:Transcript_25716/g.102641  ORF Transcript_25716/g.102641 Transcript_25716/m.102641 type:complete len:738 (-) Transcript_25716:1259-3472(-)